MTLVTPVSLAKINCVLRAMRDEKSVGQCNRLVQRVGVQRLRAAKHCAHGFHTPCGPRCYRDLVS